MKSSVLALKPVYVDTFRNGINTKVWNVWGAQHDDYVKYDRGVIRGKQVSVRNNELVVAMTKRSKPRTFSGDTKTQRWWDTGWISTKPAYGITYGAYEVEAILPTAPHISAGVWSGIWSRPFASGVGGRLTLQRLLVTRAPRPAIQGLKDSLQRFTLLRTAHYLKLLTTVTPANLARTPKNL